MLKYEKSKTILNFDLIFASLELKRWRQHTFAFGSLILFKAYVLDNNSCEAVNKETVESIPIVLAKSIKSGMDFLL